eukprot:3941933-Rhodomonas_salina.2
MSGTDKCYLLRAMSGTDKCYLLRAMSGTDVCYLLRSRCYHVKISYPLHPPVGSPICLRACYAMPGTNIAYGAMRTGA